MKKKDNKILYKKLKLFFDFIFALLVLIFGLPFFIVICLLIKVSSKGPIFFFQKRIGRNNNTFNCIKFRTMHPNADYVLKNHLMKNNLLRQEFEKTQKLKNDPRITKLGNFLRKTSLDELPQFINVIKMEMSIVGPRPIVAEEKLRYGENFKKVSSINPGITGLWQVSGRNNLSYQERIKLDLKYVKNYNLLMDLSILIRTCGVILFPIDRGAY